MTEATNATVLAVANQVPVREIARNHDISEAEVHAIVERCAADMFDGAKLRRKMFLEDVRLEALSRPHYEKGLAGDVASAVVFVKITARPPA